MDFFEKRYYWLNRKLLLLVGTWPYQDPNIKFRRTVLVYIVIMSMSVVQAIKIITAERNVDLWAEIFSNQVLIVMCLIKHFNYWIHNDRVKTLLETIKDDWASLNDNEEREIMRRTAEDGRKYNFNFLLYVYSSLPLLVLLIISPQILDIIMPMNESYPKTIPLQAEYLVDGQQYFYPIMMHLTSVIIVFLTTIAACDTMYMTLLYHASATFRLASHRLEHAFDICRFENSSNQNLKTEICRRIGAAVECHRNAVRYSEKIVSAYEMCHFATIALALINISVALYCASAFFERGLEVMSSLIIASGQMLYFFLTTHPAQKLIDNSVAVSFNAYSGQWYAAHFKTQALLLLVIRKGMNPSSMVLGKVCTLSMENYATIMQTSISYFMALLSFKSI